MASVSTLTALPGVDLEVLTALCAAEALVPRQP
jgi:hypothetical protein